MVGNYTIWICCFCFCSLLPITIFLQFLREQAALSAAEITADTITDFIADSEEESETEEPPVISTKKKALWEKILDMVDISSTRKNIMDSFQAKDNKVSVPKVNGKHNHYVNVKLKAEGDILSMGNGVARIIQTLYKEVLPGLDSWQTSKITSWHSLEGHSIQWLCVICIDRRGKEATFSYILHHEV